MSHLETDDWDLIRLTMVELTTSDASLDRSPKSNWVEKAGNLPPYIRKLARAIEKDGHDLSSAISIAISRVKAWAAGGDDVDADTRAKAAKAVAQWEALKAKNKAGKVTKLSREDGSEYLMLSNTGVFNTEIVRRSWDAQQREKRKAYQAKHGADDTAAPAYEMFPYSWIRELWTTFVIVETENRDGMVYQKIPYTVSGNDVTFGKPEPVEQVWKDAKGTISPTERQLLKEILVKK